MPTLGNMPVDRIHQSDVLACLTPLDVSDAFAEFLSLDGQDRRDVLAAAANRLDTPPGYVEKDLWVCVVLDAMFNGLPADPHRGAVRPRTWTYGRFRYEALARVR